MALARCAVSCGYTYPRALVVRGAQVLRYVGRFDASESPQCSITVEAYPADHPFAALQGTDNIVQVRVAPLPHPFSLCTPLSNLSCSGCGGGHRPGPAWRPRDVALHQAPSASLRSGSDEDTAGRSR